MRVWVLFGFEIGCSAQDDVVVAVAVEVAESDLEVFVDGFVFWTLRGMPTLETSAPSPCDRRAARLALTLPLSRAPRSPLDVRRRAPASR